MQRADGHRFIPGQREFAERDKKGGLSSFVVQWGSSNTAYGAPDPTFPPSTFYLFPPTAPYAFPRLD